MTSHPVLFLDVDGVLNAITRSTPPAGFIRGEATPFDVAKPYTGDVWFPICYNPEIIARLLKLHTDGHVHIMWLTTWGRGANLNLRTLLSLPEFDVLADPEDQPYRSMAWQDWWKAYALREFVDIHNPSKVIWLDDDIKAQGGRINDILQRPEVLAISPDERRGLTMKDLDRIEEFLGLNVHSQVNGVK